MRPIPVLMLSFLGACIACDSPAVPGDGDVHVQTPDGAPIGGATLDGGVDWERWTVRTGPDGLAEVPDRAFGAPATIRATSRYGLDVPELQPKAYVLMPTPLRLDSVGRVEGRLVRGGAGGLSTIDHAGVWRHYTYGEGVDLRSEIPLLDGRPIGHAAVGDTVWMISAEPWPFPEDTVVQAFYVGDPTAPVRLGAFTVAGARWVLRRDSLLVLGDHNREVVEVLVATADGTRRELSTIPVDGAADGFLFGDVLVLARAGWPLRLVFVDLGDPADPTVIERLSRDDWGSAIMYGDSLLIEPRGHHIGGAGGEPVAHTLVDLSDPWNPEIAGQRTADAYLWATFAGGWAAGDWARDGWTLALLRRRGEHFGLAATIAEGVGRFLRPWAVVDPPHFAVEGWMLEER